MNIDKLCRACENFEKLAQQTPRVPKANDSKFWGRLLHHALQSYAQTLSSPLMAKQAFDACALYHKSPATASSTMMTQLAQIEGALQEGIRRLQALGQDPIAVLTKLGVSNLNPNSLNVMLANLKVLQEGVDFNKYQHYYLPAHGQAKEVIELDQDTTGPGY